MDKNRKLLIYIGFITFIFALILLYIFNPTNILMEPNITPVDFLNSRPFTVLFKKWVLIVPSSTIIVYLLGLLILYIGLNLVNKEKQIWGASLIFWGIGTILAGTSYQGFGYELKCFGNEFCQFTSWFELSYLLTTAISISLMAIAFAKTFTAGKMSKFLTGYSLAAIITYTFLLLLGAIIENKTLISYELFTVFFMPLFVVFFIININNYKNRKNNLDKTFIYIWVIFLIVNVGYYLYYLPDFTNILYSNTNFWFSANDVLHVGLIIWFLYFQFKAVPQLIDSDN